jgi:twinfilin-like protein
MLYASTRNSVTRSLGSAHFTDSIFATSKQDLTAEAYNKHKLHMAAPKPLSAREKSLADLAAAEKEAGQSAYQGSSVRTTLIPPGVGMDLSEEDQALLTDLAEGSILTFVGGILVGIFMT